MEWGDHDPLVREVIDFAEHGQLLSGIRRPLPSSGYLVVGSPGTEDVLHFVSGSGPRDALKLATTEPDRPSCRFPGGGGATIRPLDLSWRDRRLFELGLVREQFDASTHIEPRIPVLSQTLENRLVKQLGAAAWLCHLDLLLAAAERAVSGAREGLPERIFHAYQAGGWPCGYLAGDQLVVFSPKNAGERQTLLALAADSATWKGNEDWGKLGVTL